MTCRSSCASTTCTRPRAAFPAIPANGRAPRVIASGMLQLRERSPERLAEITASVAAYDASLARFGLRDRDIDRRVPLTEAAGFALREGLLALVLGPLALLSLAFFVIPYRLTALVSRFAPDLKSPGHLVGLRGHGRLRGLDRRDRRRGSLAHRRRQRPAGRRRGGGARVRRRRRHRAGAGGAAHRAGVLRAAPDPARRARAPPAPACGACRRPGPGARVAHSRRDRPR